MEDNEDFNKDRAVMVHRSVMFNLTMVDEFVVCHFLFIVFSMDEKNIFVMTEEKKEKMLASRSKFSGALRRRKGFAEAMSYLEHHGYIRPRGKDRWYVSKKYARHPEE